MCIRPSDTPRVPAYDLHTCACRSDNVVGEIALGGLEKEDKELHQLDFAVFSKVNFILPLHLHLLVS